MGSGLFGTNILSGNGFFCFYPTPNASIVGCGRNLAGGSGATAPDTNAPAPSAPRVNADDESGSTQIGLNGVTSGGAYTSGGGAGGASRAPAYSQEDLAYLDSQMGNLNNQYGRTDTTLRDALDAVLQNYNKELGGANLTRGRNIEDFNTKTQVSEQGRGRELGKVDTNARMLANSLRQRLGLGAGASSAQNVAGEAVARQASEQRGDVLGDYAANFMELDTNKRRSEEDYNSMLKELDTQKLQREGGVRGDIETQRNSIRENQGRIAGEKAKLLGGGYTGVRSAMAPYDAKIAGGESLIDSIYSKYAAKYNVNPLQTRNTNLRDYATDNVAVRDQAQGGEEYSPYKNPFQEDEEQPLGY